MSLADFYAGIVLGHTDQIHKETEVARDDGMIAPADADAIVQTAAVLKFLVGRAVERGGSKDEGQGKTSRPTGGPPSLSDTHVLGDR